MPVDRNALSEDGDALAIRTGSNKHRVLTFLAAHPDEAFSRKEVIEGADINENSAGAVLSRLREEGLVVYEDGYWAIAEDRRLTVLDRLIEEVEDLAERFDLDEFVSRLTG